MRCALILLTAVLLWPAAVLAQNAAVSSFADIGSLSTTDTIPVCPANGCNTSGTNLKRFSTTELNTFLDGFFLPNTSIGGYTTNNVAVLANPTGSAAAPMGTTFAFANGLSGACLSTTCTIASTIPDRTVASGSTTIGAGDSAGQVNLSTASTGVNNPAAGTAPYSSGGSLILNNLSVPSVTVTNAGTVNGVCGGTTFILYKGGFCNYTSNGSSLDSWGFPGAFSIPANDASGGSLAIGPGALAALNAVSSGSLTAVGYQALTANTTGTFNTAIGTSALAFNTTGTGNTAVGLNALQANVSAGDSTAVGANSLIVNTAPNNTGVGEASLESNTTGTPNLAIGDNSLHNNTTGGYNVAIGPDSLSSTTVSSSSTAVGAETLPSSNYSGGTAANTAIGAYSGHNITTGTGNSVIGYNAGSILTSGGQDTIIGYSVGSTTLQTGTQDILLGTAANCDLGAAISNTFVLCASSGSTPLLQGNLAAGSLSLTDNGSLSAVSYATATNCQSSASPAVCGSAAAGMVAVPTGTNPTLVVDTTAVTANSEIMVNADESLGTALGITCNSTITTQAPVVVTARTAGTSFTIQVDASPATNKVCVSYQVIN